jgi:hypothetical protein
MCSVHGAPDVQSTCAVYMGPLMCSVHGAPDVKTNRPIDLQTYSTWGPCCVVFMGSVHKVPDVQSICAVYMGPLMCSLYLQCAWAPVCAVYMGPLMIRPIDLQTYIPTDLQTYRPTVHGAPDVLSIYAVYKGALMCSVYVQYTWGP